MDQILKGLLESDKPDGIKKTLVVRVKQQGSQVQTTTVIRKMLAVTTNFILQSQSEFNVDLSKEVYLEWAKYNRSTLDEFWTAEYVNYVLDAKFRNAHHALWLLSESFKLLQTSARFLSLCQIIEARAVGFIRENPSSNTVIPFCKFLDEYKDCIPKGDNSATLCMAIIRAVSTFTAPEKAEQMRHYIQGVSRVIGKFLKNVWQTNRDCITQCLKIIFQIISHVEKDLEPCNALGGIVQYVPLEMITTVTKSTVEDANILDAQMTAALLRMIDWLSWPMASNIDKWVIAFLSGLASVHKYTILIDVTENRVVQVYGALFYPVVRESAFNVLSHMLLSFQHSPQPFHRIVQKVPETMRMLHYESAKYEAVQHFMVRFAAFMHSLMQLHPGFPDLYEPVLEAVKNLPKPSSDEIQRQLSQSKWTAQKVRSYTSDMSRFAQRSETGKTGLVNLGNTCYMNSVLQALFMCDSFRCEVLSSPPSPQQNLLVKLQYVFSFLSMTQRASYSPRTFLEASRPPWFSSGHQQDCSEFLKYYLDQMHEQEVLRLRRERQALAAANSPSGTAAKQEAHHGNGLPPTLIQRTFGGKLVTTYKCLNCGYESNQLEMFTDIPLPFPNQGEVSASGMKTRQWGKSLVGGDNKGNSTKESKKEKDVKKESKDGESGAACDAVNLEDMIRYYLEPEKLHGDNKYSCEQCRGLQDGERVMKIVQSPEYLTLTLLRFAYNIKSKSRSKIFSDVIYPKTLYLPVSDKDLDETGSQTLSKKSRTNRSPPTSRNSSRNMKKEIYSLCSVIVHSGMSSECGHYYCYARHSVPVSQEEGRKTVTRNGASNTEIDYLQDKWYLFNDSRITYSNFDSFSSVTKRFSKDTAYVLAYKKIGSDAMCVDADTTIHTALLDPVPRKDLRDAVERDNKLFLQEQELEGRSQAMKKKAVSSTDSTYYNWKDSDDQGPPGNCGGGGGLGGLDTSGSRFVF